MLTKEDAEALRRMSNMQDATPIDPETLADIASAIESELGDRAKRDADYQALQDIGKSAAECIAEMVAALECDYDRLKELRENEVAYKEEPTVYAEELDELADLEKAAGDCESREDAERRIAEDPLSVEVRSSWATLGDPLAPEEFCILLGTGGPATRIIGELSGGEPSSARLQAQDWFKPWTDYTGDAVSQDDLLTYCRCFYFGE